MKRHSYSTEIAASPSDVWAALWTISNYEQWTSAFAEGSTVQTNGWAKGSKVLFLDGKGSGMVSIIDDNRHNEYMAFRHIGQIINGKEDTTSEKIKEWAGALESYTLLPTATGTQLIVEIDLHDEWLAYFEKTWPVALENIRRLAENANGS